jgi:hypothetical protein
MKLRVKSDGTDKGIWVEDENGNRIENVREVQLRASYDSCPEVNMTFFVPPNRSADPVTIKIDATGTTPDVENRIKATLDAIEEAAKEMDEEDDHQG